MRPCSTRPPDCRPNLRSGELNDITYFARASTTDLYALVPTVRAAVRALDAQVPLVSPRSMEHVVAQSMARTSFVRTLLAIAAGSALLLSAVGIYGVIAYLVSQRRTEIGIRLALGATASDVVRQVVMQSARPAVAGVVLGLVAALLGSRLLVALLYGVQATDIAVLAGGTALLVLVVLAASWVPALRAARVNPGEAMQHT